MHRWLTAASMAAALVVLGCVAASAAPTPSSGTLSPLTPLLTWTDGPFTGANPTNNVPNSVGPNCGAVPNSCSDYLLTVDIPAGYSALHPNDVVAIKVSWPDATVNDFDVYVLDAAGTAQAYPGSTTNADPEIASFHVVDGTATYLVRVAAFQTANESYAAVVTLGPPSSRSPILANSYSIGSDVWSCNTHLGADSPSGPPPVLDHNLDGEPLVSFDANGRLYIAALDGVGGGCGMWYSDDACAQAYTFVGTPDDGAGGGDAEVVTAPAKNALGYYNVYTSSLSLANITSAVSFDGGNTFTATPVSGSPVVDRNWQAAYGSSICYLSYVNGATQPGNAMEVVRLDYSGMAEPVIAPPSIVWDPLHVDPQQSHQKGNIVVDQRAGANTTLLQAGPNGEGTVYTSWTENGQKVYVSASTDFGTTWTHRLVWDGGTGSSYDHIFVWLACDSAGNLYIVFSDDRNVYLATSTDHAVTWSTPVRVNRGGGASNACIFPQIAAGTPGRVVIAFFGTSATTPHDAAAEWAVYVARSQNALAAQPDFEEVKVNDKPFHSGAVCEDGLNCSSGRELSDNFDIDIDPVDGSAGLAYGVFGVSGSFMARQVSGASAIAGKSVTDRSSSCPTPANDCMAPPLTGSPCIGPGYVTVVADPVGNADVPPAAMASQDIVSVGVGEPAGSNALVFAVKVSALDPGNLPPNTFWRVSWNGPGGKRYVDVVHCATGGLSSHYGHFTTGSVEDGPSDGFTVTGDGYITVTIDRSKVDSPAVGSTLAGVNADCRTIAGSCPIVGSAAFAPNDVTDSGQYLVVGNGFCTPLTVSCPPPATFGPGDHTLEFTVTNPGTGTHAVVGEVHDTNGWLGTQTFLAGPLGAGQSGTASVTVHVPGDCMPAADDALTFHVTSADLPDAAECTSQVHCTPALGVGPDAPRELALAIAGPNPCRRATTLSYALPRGEVVRLDVYSASGRRLRTLVSGYRPAGRYRVSFDTGHGDGRLGSGVYFLSLSAGGEKRTVTVTTLE